jgi:prepilin peptidase CpaA
MPDQLSQYLLGTPLDTARSVLVILGAYLLMAAWCDARHRRIPNSLVLSGALLAILLHTALPAGDGFLAYWPGGLGPWKALGGLAFGFLALLPLYVLRGMGAGDVKLLAMLGAFLGPVHFWGALLFALLAGGLLAIAFAWQRGILAEVLNNLRLMLWSVMLKLGNPGAPAPQIQATPTATLPFGVAIASGGIAYLIFRAQSVGLI